MTKKINAIGLLKGRLKCLEERGKYLFVACQCGIRKEILRVNFLAGYTQSCGCLRNERVAIACSTHGLSGTKIYSVWKTMRRRCNDPEHDAYPWYGAKGIKVCPEWDASFDAFWQDFGYLWEDGLSIDRIKATGNYEPGNVQWITKAENSAKAHSGAAF